MNRLDHYRAVLFGGIIAAILLSMFYVFRNDEPKPEAPKSKFEVIDHYKKCDVVRYTDDTNRWQYFLHCNNTRPIYEQQ